MRRQLQVSPLTEPEPEPEPEPERTRTHKLNHTNHTNEPEQALLHKPETKAKMARSHAELEPSNAASPHKPKPTTNQNPRTNPRPSRHSLIPDNGKPEFNLEYLRFTYQQDPKRLASQILKALHQRDNAKDQI